MTSPASVRTYSLDTNDVAWIPAGAGLSFKPLAYLAGNAGWVQLLRLEPGTVIPRHRHTGEVHAINVSGQRMLIDTGEVIGPWTYVHESPGDVDTWMAIGDEPCIVHIEVRGTVEYLDEFDEIDVVVDGALQYGIYEAWCREHHQTPHPGLAPLEA
jgi:2,4'-dihydroxyacetophenone dioxygenase